MNKKVFISYSWGTKEHQEWVINLGKRLMNDTVDVILDRWDLKEGQDVFAFMESMVKADDVFRVLIICDKNYSIKADDRQGGVGTETQIITPEIYSNQNQEKFIPIVIERDDNNNPYLPIFLSSRKYIDFSNEEYFGSSYEELLRNILEAPLIPKPKLGTKIPTYITDSNVNNSVTNSIVRTINEQLKKFPEKVNSYSSNFIDSFLETLWEFEFKGKSHAIEGFGAELEDNLKSLKPIKEDYIDFLKIVTKPELDLDVDELINFFEKKGIYSRPKENVGSWSSTNYENFKIIFQELFIYTIAICLKNKNYSLAGELLHSKYFYYDPYTGKSEAKRFTFLYEYHRNFEDYHRKVYNKITGFGHYTIANLSDKIKKEEYILGDTICHYIGELYKGTDYRDSWFPATHLYKERYGNFEFFERLSSKRYFDKVKEIYDVSSHEELKELLNHYKNSVEGKERIRYGGGSFESISFIHEVINIDDIGKFR